MRFDFFTFGGGQYWEDVFFYQKWRIQRNYSKKYYRLLDPWDIRRFSGTFEECRRAFIEQISIHEIARQKGHMIIMLHGLGDTKNIFKPLWRKALDEGFMAAAINYPSRLKHMDSHVRQLEFLLDNLEDVEKVSFVAKGIGGLVLRKLMAKASPWQEKLKIGRIVQVGTQNKSSELLEKMSEHWIFRWLLGPMLSEVRSEAMPKIPEFKKNREFGVISTDYAFRDFTFLLPRAWKEVLPQPKDCALKGEKERIYIRCARFNPFKSRKIVNATINFIKKGTFN